jgi:probable HAF family extracellular repeat protein
MKTRFLLLLTAVSSFAVLATTVGLAQHGQDHQHKHHRYKAIDIGTLGGPSGFLGFERSRNINNRGELAASTDTATPNTPPFCFNDCYVQHTTQWRDGVLTDLGALPGSNSGTTWISDAGSIAGLSQLPVIDPLTGSPELEAMLWSGGKMTALGTLGGNESVAESVNDRDQVVGFALNSVPDQFSGFGTQMRGFLWQSGAMQDLGTLGGPDANAFIVNERTQVTGWSSTNSTPARCYFRLTTDPFLWQDGKMIDLGTLGGTCGFPNWLNNRGEVVGQSNLAGDSTFHPFLWRRGKMSDLGTLGGNFGTAYSISEAEEIVGWSTTSGDSVGRAFLWKRGRMSELGVVPGERCSVAYAINAKEQIVGGSDDNCGGFNPRALLWDHGSVIDLNAFVSPNSGVQLTVALSIDERGTIASLGVVPWGDQHVFVLIPCDEGHSDEEGCDYSPVDATAAAFQTSPAVRGASSRTPPPSLMRRMDRVHLPGSVFGPRN